MHRTTARILVGAAAAASTVGLAIGPASAATWAVSPANTAFTATQSGSATMKTGSTTVTCTGGSVSGTTGSSTASDLATLSSGSESGCSSSIGGSVSVSLSGGDLAGSSYSNGVTTGTVSGLTAKASVSELGLTCSITASGSPAGTYTNSSSKLAITNGTMTITSASGSACGLVGISSGDTVTVNAAYVASPAITVTSS